MTIDFRTLEDFRAAVSARQKELIAAIPADLRNLPRFRLVQLKLLPSRAEIGKSLFQETSDGQK